MSHSSMGIGELGSPNVIFSSKRRWFLEAKFPAGDIPYQMVSFGKRPVHDLENGGFAQRGEITTTFIDVNPGEPSLCLYLILGDFYQFGANFFTTEGVELEEIRKQVGTLKIDLFVSDGSLFETFEFGGVFPVTINFGELCYSSSEEVDIEVTWRYNSCSYISHTPKVQTCQV